MNKKPIKKTRWCDIHNKPKLKLTDWGGDDVYMCNDCWAEKGFFSGKKSPRKKS